jgi:hypothetical protein
MADRHTPQKYLKKTVQVLRDEGIRSFGVKGLRKIADKVEQSPQKTGKTVHVRKKKFTSIVDRRDVMLADWAGTIYRAPKARKEPLKVTNWVISPPAGGGGHQNMFRFIEHLDKNGYTNNVYLYSAVDPMPLGEAKSNVSKYATLSNTTFHYYKRGSRMADADIIFATGWETAYPVFNEKTDAKKFYFVQDFEPYFYSIGTEYILAENTYHFGFQGITAGNWLSKKLSADYGMKCDSYDFGAEKSLYTFTNSGQRKEIFFYARPVTERRAFDLGIMTLEIFHELHPDYTINLAGWDVSTYDVPFPYVNHKALRLEDLSDLYNRCATGLVLSLTNMSLLPLELLSCGVIPVVNDGDNNRDVSNNPFISYAQPSPVSLAKAMSDVVERKDAPEYAKKASDSVNDASWEHAKEKFMGIIEAEIHD